MVRARFVAPNLIAFARVWRQAPALAEREWRAGVAQGAAILRTALAAETPKRTGATAAQWVVRMEGGGLQAEAQIENPSPIARMLLTGTRPHVIVARRARALWFAAGGQTVYARRVQHPGTRPDDFAGRAVAGAWPRVVRVMERRGANALRALKAGSWRRG